MDDQEKLAAIYRVLKDESRLMEWSEDCEEQFEWMVPEASIQRILGA